ncbi:hypothetical protein OG871_28440 [Kitasatospora sp. NBC_00374]|uniref:Rv1733c family protein n=1 Tax=Kitasatospora sp. NBC_00374 TaxID=2975964 RepID=UPI00324870E6
MSRRPARTGRAGGPTTLRGHLRRAAGREANPLCRASDRARSRLVVWFVLALAASVVAGLALTALAWHDGLHAADTDALHRHRVSATTSAVAGDAADTPVGSGVEGSDSVLVEAGWSYPSAGQVSGWVAVPPGTAAGSRVAIWVDDAGQAAPGPRSGTDIALSAVVTGLLTSSALATAAGAACAVRSRMLDRRALATWEPAWEQVEPRWSGRTPGRPGGTEP